MSTSPHPFLLSDLRRAYAKKIALEVEAEILKGDDSAERARHERRIEILGAMAEPIETDPAAASESEYRLRTIVAGGKLQYVILQHGRKVMRNFSRLSSGGSTAALWKACALKAKLDHPEDPSGRAANQQAALDFTLISRELKLNGNGST